MRKHDWYSDTDPKALKVFIERQRHDDARRQKIRGGVPAERDVCEQVTGGQERQLHPEADDR